jgi:hypothetical protein
MNPNHTLGVLSGTEELRISIEPKDIAMLAVGVFAAMLLALLIVKYT